MVHSEGFRTERLGGAPYLSQALKSPWRRGPTLVDCRGGKASSHLVVGFSLGFRIEVLKPWASGLALGPACLTFHG